MIDKSSFRWPEGCRSAVSVTYDDALPCHYEFVGPHWEAVGLRSTFYTQIVRAGQRVNGVVCNPEAWREMAARGHELGNHSLCHPCHHQPGRDWLRPEYDLGKYTPTRWTDEMRAANFALSLLDGKTERSYGNTCYHTELGSGASSESLEPYIEELFVAARGSFADEAVDVETINYNALGHFGGDTHDGGQSFENMRRQIDEAAEAGRWVIYCIHGVGEGTHGFYISLDEHAKLVDFLGERSDSIWTAPVVDIAKYLQGCDPDLRQRGV